MNCPVCNQPLDSDPIVSRVHASFHRDCFMSVASPEALAEENISMMISNDNGKISADSINWYVLPEFPGYLISNDARLIRCLRRTRRAKEKETIRHPVVKNLSMIGFNLMDKHGIKRFVTVLNLRERIAKLIETSRNNGPSSSTA